MTIHERVKTVRKTLNMSQTTFGESLGVGIGVIKNIEYAFVDPKEPFLSLICKNFNVNPDWLMHGDGEMFLDKSVEDELQDFLANVVTDDDESIRKRFILALSKLDGDDWKTVEKFLDAFTGAQKEKDTE